VRFAYVADGAFDYRGGVAMTSAVVMSLWTGHY
jgi:hypothetical protein